MVNCSAMQMQRLFTIYLGGEMIQFYLMKLEQCS